MKKLIIKLVLLLLPFVLLVAYANVIIDPYGFLHDMDRDNGFTADERFIKMSSVLSRDENYEILLFGSSRVGGLHLNNVCDADLYNMSYSAGTIDNYYDNINNLYEAEKMPKHLIIGLDSISICTSTSNAGYIKNYPADNNLFGYYYEQVEETDYYQLYKNHIDFLLHYEKYHSYIPSSNSTQFNHDEYGNRCAIYADDFIESNPELHASRDYFVPGKVDNSNPVDVQTTISYIEKIQSLCDKSGTELTIVLIPNYCAYYIGSNPDSIIEFISEYCKTGTLYSFAGINSVTTDSMMWYETSHYREFVGDIMGNFIINGKIDSSLAEQGFGVKVDCKNRLEITEMLKEQLKAWE